MLYKKFRIKLVYVTSHYLSFLIIKETLELLALLKKYSGINFTIIINYCILLQQMGQLGGGGMPLKSLY